MVEADAFMYSTHAQSVHIHCKVRSHVSLEPFKLCVYQKQRQALGTCIKMPHARGVTKKQIMVHKRQNNAGLGVTGRKERTRAAVEPLAGCGLDKRAQNGDEERSRGRKRQMKEERECK